MVSKETLTSLAMLKVNIDQGRDYLDYLRPFILQVLFDKKPDPINDQVVHDLLHTRFGLDIPTRTIQVVLKRLSRNYPLKRQEGVYRIAGDLPNPRIVEKTSEAERHIHAVINGLLEFAKGDSRPLMTEEGAISAIISFLLEFSISCLRAYLRGTTIPSVESKKNTDIVLVSDYALHLQRNDPERFESFQVMVQGHMLANALLCPDLQNAPKSYKTVTFYLDTPLLIQQIGLEGEPKKRAANELIALVRKLGGMIAAFSHSREELVHVIKGAAEHINSSDGKGAVVMEARRSGTTKSDLLLLAGRVDRLLEDAWIKVKKTPPHIGEFQIDETAFESILEDEVHYFNPRAREYDINSVRCIYVLRAKTTPDSIERCKAALVTSNTAFACAAYEYGKQHKESREVSSVITDFSLANMAWLKAPVGAPNVPMTEVLAYSYAALQPSEVFLENFLSEIEKLQKRGTISERDHQLLRSSTIAQEELMRLTLGDEAALSEKTITEILRRVTAEIKKEESEKIIKEQESHLKTRQQLSDTLAERESLQKRIYWRCRKKSHLCALAASYAVSVFLVLGVIAGLNLKLKNPLVGWLLFVGSLVLAIINLASHFLGTNARKIYEKIQAKCLTHFLRKEAKATGIDFGENG